MADNPELTQAFKTADTRPLNDRLQAVLDGPFAAIRDKARAFISRPELAPVPADLPKEQYREITLDRVRMMVDAGFTQLPYDPQYGGGGRIADSIIAAEMIAHADMSLAIKQGVQFGLFGTSIERLGTEKHKAAYLRDIMDGKLLGGFAMTEERCGSDVQGTRTEAIYDHATRSFTINTPDNDARKTYIGNAACHGRMMVVFAQLKMGLNEESKGVHAILVPIRDENGKPVPGVTIEDNGHKNGLNGVDNGKLSFDHVNVPYDNLLDRFGQIDKNGDYQSDIKKDTTRFFSMIGTLVTGRVFVSMASLSGAKNALASAINWTDQRTAFGGSLLDKQATRTALLPRLAEAYALHFATRDLLTAFGEGRRETETMAAALKSFASDWAFKTVDVARELAGGQGYMSEERYGVLRNDIDVFRTFEGANTVLRMLTAKNQLGRLAEKFKDSSTRQQRHKKEAIFLKEIEALLKRGQANSQLFLDSEYQTKLFVARERSMAYALGEKFNILKKKFKNKDQAANECQDRMIEYANAYAERRMLQSLTAAVEAQSDPEVKALLKDVCDLFAVHTIHNNATWYLEEKHLSPRASKLLRAVENKLNQKIRPYAQTLVDAFGIPEQLLSGYKPAPQNTVHEPGPAP